MEKQKKSLVKFGNAPRNKTQENFPKKQLSTQKSVLNSLAICRKLCVFVAMLRNYYTTFTIIYS